MTTGGCDRLPYVILRFSAHEYLANEISCVHAYMHLNVIEMTSVPRANISKATRFHLTKYFEKYIFVSSYKRSKLDFFESS